MQKLLKHIDWGAIGMAFVFAYAGPILLACTTNPTLWLFAFWLGAPILAGYLVAHFARIVPSLHGLIVAVVGGLIFFLILPPRPIVFWLVWLPITISCSLYGARLWKRRQQRS